MAFRVGSSGVLDHTIQEYGGSSQGLVYIASDAVQVLNSVVQYSANTGIVIHAASPLISATQFLNNSGGGLYNNSGNPTILKSTFIGNSTWGSGGGLYNSSGNPTIQNNIFTNNIAASFFDPGNGGGLYNDSGSPIIENNLFMANSSGTSTTMGSGGGLYNNTGSPIIQNNTFISNTIFNYVGGDFMGTGGGLYNGSGNPTIQYNTFTGNSAGESSGGGLYNDSGNPTIQNNTFSSNSAYSGGGLLNYSGAPLIQNNNFISNTRTGLSNPFGFVIIQNNNFYGNSGYGLYNGWGDSVIQNNTFIANSGGGLRNDHGRPVIRNNIVVNNIASEGGAIYDDPYHGPAPILDYNDVWNNTGGDYFGVVPGAHDISIDPRLVNPANEDFRLATGSPCIDAGDPENYPLTDFEGDPRAMGMAPDIGSDEYRSLRVAKAATPEEASSGAPITYTIKLVNPGAFQLTDVLLTDNLPIETQFTGYQGDGLTCTHNGSIWGGQLSCTLDSGSLAPGESRTLTLNGFLTDTLPMPKYVTNTLTAIAAGHGETFSAYAWASTWVSNCTVQLNDTPMGRDPQAAIDASKQSSDVVKISGYCRVHNLSLNKTLTFQGGWSPDFDTRDNVAYATTLDAQGLGSVIRVEENVSPTIEGFIITGGSAFSGGGLVNVNGDPTIQNNIFTGNYAFADDEGGGGGIANFFGNPLIVNNTFTGNRSDWSGGGIYSESGNPVIQNNTFYSNTSGLYFFSTSAIIQNNTIYNNSGVGLSVENGNPLLRNNIFVNNAGPGIVGSIAASPILDYNDVWNNAGGNYYYVAPGIHDISADPLLVDPNHGDFHLAPGSPCIDAGDPVNYPPTDFEGDPRPCGAAPDIGADEYFSPP